MNCKNELPKGLVWEESYEDLLEGIKFGMDFDKCLNIIDKRLHNKVLNEKACKIMLSLTECI